MSDSQTAGRGQGQNVWQSTPGLNITASIYLNSGFLPARRLFMLNVITSLAIQSTLQHYGIQHTAIKWPNDVYASGKKTAGILIENIVAPGTIHSIVGIGLNVNQLYFPHQLSTKATSMALLTGSTLPLMQVTDRLLQALENNYLTLKQHGDAELLAQYNAALLGRNVLQPCAIHGIAAMGQILQALPDGMLQVQVNGSLLSLRHKEIEWPQNI